MRAGSRRRHWFALPWLVGLLAGAAQAAGAAQHDSQPDLSSPPTAQEIAPAQSSSTEADVSRAAEPAKQQAQQSRPPQNIIFIMTDDQRWDTVAGVAPEQMPQDVMPNVATKLMQNGVVFTEAFITSPICGPARASITSGGFYCQHTGSTENSWPNGGALRFHDGQTLATLLFDKGYRTALIGKYINDYNVLEGYDEAGDHIPTRRYVPPGWSVWLGYLTGVTEGGGYHGGYKTIIGANDSNTWPAAGLLLPNDVQLPNDISVLDNLMQQIEPRGFPATLSSYVRSLYTRPGDYNQDGELGEYESRRIHGCTYGPGEPVGSLCGRFDSDADTDVDLADFACFQREYGGLPYFTDFQREAALAFLADDEIAEQPFFLMISLFAPHGPAFPATEDADAFAGFEYRGRGWGEDDLSDKPRHMQELYVEPSFTEYYEESAEFSMGRTADETHRDQLRCLRAADRLVGAVVDAVDGNQALADNTVIIFASDNGDLWGEHKKFFKAHPHEESIRVPLVVRAPDVAPGTVNKLVAVDLDVPATVLNLAGYSEEEIVTAPLSNGSSLLPLLEDPQAPWRDHLLFEMGRREDVMMRPAWATIRTEQWKYTQYDYLDGDALAEELYDLEADPFELVNLRDDPAHAAQKDALAAILNQERGLFVGSMVDPVNRLPDPTLGIEYTLPLDVTGGTPPYSCELWTEDPGPTGLPDGLSIDGACVISGTATETGVFTFTVKVQDSSASPHHGGPQWFVRSFVFVVLE